MNEHELQQILVRRWLASGLEMADGERLLLVAWEVMANWEINNQMLGGWRPSIDFLALDRDARLVAIELKHPSVTAPAKTWAQLCQVTVRAVSLGSTYRPEFLRHVHDECLSGRHGRVDTPAGDLGDRFEALFSAPLRLRTTIGPVRRVIAAAEFGASVPGIVEQFEANPFSATTAYLRSVFSTRSGPLAKEVPRLEAIDDDNAALVTERVETLIIDTAAEDDAGLDSQQVEIVGRTALIAALVRDGLEIAEPIRDRGIDLIVYDDQGDFDAVPVQIKAFRGAAFGVWGKYEAFDGLRLVFVWNVETPSDTEFYCLSSEDSAAIADELGWTDTNTWRTKSEYFTSSPSQRLRAQLEPHRMQPGHWRNALGL